MLYHKRKEGRKEGRRQGRERGRQVRGRGVEGRGRRGNSPVLTAPWIYYPIPLLPLYNKTPQKTCSYSLSASLSLEATPIRPVFPPLHGSNSLAPHGGQTQGSCRGPHHIRLAAFPPSQAPCITWHPGDNPSATVQSH